MKKITITFVCFITLAANAQKIKTVDVPENVKTGFSKKYPTVKVETWEKEGANYEAEFDLNKIESSAVFDVNGNFKELEQEIKSSELPQPVINYCTQKFTDYKLQEAARITDASGTITYEAELKKGKESFDAIFDDKGNFIKKS